MVIKKPSSQLTFLLLFFIMFLVLCDSKNKQSPSNYEFKSRLKSTCLGLYPIDLDQDGEDEIVALSPGQIDVRDLESLKHIASFGIPRYRKYDVIPLITGTLDSLCFLFQYETKDSSVYKLFKRYYSQSGLNSSLEDFLVFTGEDRDKDGEFHQTVKPVGFLNEG